MSADLLVGGDVVVAVGVLVAGDSVVELIVSSGAHDMRSSVNVMRIVAGIASKNFFIPSSHKYDQISFQYPLFCKPDTEFGETPLQGRERLSITGRNQVVLVLLVLRDHVEDWFVRGLL
jgi:hypothetical protein